MAATDLPGPRAAPPWRVRLDAFWRWWTGELRAFVYERFPVLRGVADVPLVAFEGEQLVLLDAPPAVGADARIELAGLELPRVRLALQALLRRAGETRGRVRLCLGPGEALVRRAAMPAATEENLAQVLAFEMDRLTPFRAEDVYFDFRVVARDAAAGQIVLQLAVARRDLVDPRVQRLRELGASVQGVLVRDAHGAGALQLDLLPSEQRGQRETARERLVQRSLVGAVAVLLALALLIPAWQKRQTIIALQPLLARAQREASSTNAIADSMQRQVEDYNFIVGRKQSLYPVLAYVEEVSRLLPDTTWLQQMQIRSTGKVREVEITGETTSSSKLIEILSRSALLKNPTPRGTMTRGSTPNSERFMIQAEAPPRPLPEPGPILSSSAPAASRPPPQAQPAARRPPANGAAASSAAQAKPTPAAKPAPASAPTHAAQPAFGPPREAPDHAPQPAFGPPREAPAGTAPKAVK